MFFCRSPELCSIIEIPSFQETNTMSEENKSTYHVLTEARKKANTKYRNEKTDPFFVSFPKGKKQYYKDAAAAAGLSLNQFVITAIDEKIERDGLSEKNA